MSLKMKKRLITVASLALVLVIAIGVTLAFLTYETERRANNFTFATEGEGLRAMLTEPTWDGIIDYDYSTDDIIIPIYGYITNPDDWTGPEIPVYGYTNGDIKKPVTDIKSISDTTIRPNGSYGDEDAQNMVPGASVAKNPIITNTGSITDAWVAAKITFVYAAGSEGAGKPLSAVDMAAVDDIIDIDYDTVDWENTAYPTLAGGSREFRYRKILQKDNDGDVEVYGDSTEPLFTTVTIKDTATNEEFYKVENFGGFAIYIEGFATQSIAADDYGEFKQLDITFGNTPTDSAPVIFTELGVYID